MRAIRSILLLAVALLLAGCDAGSSLLGPPELRGTWRSVSDADVVGPEYRLTFGPGQAYRATTEWRDPSGALTESIRTEGRYRMEGDRLWVFRERTEHWAKYALEPRRVVDVAFPPRWSDVASVHVEGDRLTYTYVAAPLDVPQTFTSVFLRER